MRKKTKKSAEKENESLPEDSDVESNTDSNALHEGVKFRVTFLVGQSFRGAYYEKGQTIELPENDAKAYSKRTGLKIERME